MEDEIPEIITKPWLKRDDIASKYGAVAAWVDEGTGLVKVLLRGKSFNSNGISTLTDKNGARLTDEEFDYLDNSSDGLLLACVRGGKYGYLDSSGSFAVSPIYDWAQHFHEGRAWVVRNGKHLIIDKKGMEIQPESLPQGDYVEVCPFFHGRARISIVDFTDENGWKSLAFYHDNEQDAGVWGYVDKNGKLLVSPQYIFAEDFSGKLAIVCKGKWTHDEKWNNRLVKGRVWSERMDWGAIDRAGKEVIPCKFKEIRWRPWDSKYHYANDTITKRYLAAQDYNDQWGIIDFHGNWIVPPQFGDIDYCDTSPNGDMFVFYSENMWINVDETPCGVYSISRQCVLIPAEKFVEITFEDDQKVTCSTFDGQSEEIHLPELTKVL